MPRATITFTARLNTSKTARSHNQTHTNTLFLKKNPSPNADDGWGDGLDTGKDTETLTGKLKKKESDNMFVRVHTQETKKCFRRGKEC